MKKLIHLSFIICFSFSLSGQKTLIATSNSPTATANHNQRKIVRSQNDDFTIVYEDIVDGVPVVKTRSKGLIAEGHSPTLSINNDGYVYLVYVTNGSQSQIAYKSKSNELNSDWSTETIISDNMGFNNSKPVADVDSMGQLNVMWVQENYSTLDHLILTQINADTVTSRKVILKKHGIKDIAIANHLQYYMNDLIFGITYDQDSIQFYGSDNNHESYSSLYSTIGSNPCITFNSESEDFSDYGYILRFLHIDTEGKLIEVQMNNENNGQINTHILNNGPIENVCVDDLIPPLGYSYLYLNNGVLKHGFSYGPYVNNHEMSTISQNAIHPSIAYKQFRFYVIDYIWMEENNGVYDIYHNRENKHEWLATEEEKKDGFTITGYPNPFTEKLTISIKKSKTITTPQVDIFDSTGKLVKELKLSIKTNTSFNFIWDGHTTSGAKCQDGIYMIRCTIDNARTSRKVILGRG